MLPTLNDPDLELRRLALNCLAHFRDIPAIPDERVDRQVYDQHPVRIFDGEGRKTFTLAELALAL